MFWSGAEMKEKYSYGAYNGYNRVGNQANSLFLSNSNSFANKQKFSDF